MSHDPYLALREPGFRRYLVGNIIATVGQTMQNVAIGWELYERTGKALALGLVGLVQVIPIIVLTLPAGHVVDRFERKRVLLAALGVLATAAFGLSVVSWRHAPILYFYGFLFLNGCARAFYNPAKGSVLPQTLSREKFPNAATWNSGGWQLAAVLGPAVGGALIALSRRPSLVYALNVFAILTFFFLLLAVHVREGRTLHLASDQNTEGLSRRIHDAFEGIRFVWKTKILLAALTLDLFAVLFGGATALLPIYAKDILHVGPSGLGWLLAADSIGAVSMALVLAHRPPFRKAGRTLILAVTGFGLSTVVFGVSHWFALSFLMLFLLGGFDSISVVIRTTLAQLRTPEHMRGRVSAVNSLFIGTSNELGGFESGAVAALFGPVVSVVAGGIATILVVAAVGATWPDLRHLDRLEES